MGNHETTKLQALQRSSCPSRDLAQAKPENLWVLFKLIASLLDQLVNHLLCGLPSLSDAFR